MTHPNYTRPVRGAVRLDDMTWDVDVLREEISKLTGINWKSRDYGTNWSDVALFLRGKDGERLEHDSLAKAPNLRAVVDAFPAPAVDMALASLAPGGDIKEHRDISGGTAANIVRFHIPIVTHTDVAFYVSSHRVTMAPGEVWHLDTTYLHKVTNNSDVNRIHLIIDLEQTSELVALLPRKDIKDRLHTVYFYWICMTKAAALLVANPRSFAKRVRDFFKLKFGRTSVLYNPDDL